MHFVEWLWAFPVASAVHATCIVAICCCLHQLHQVPVVFVVMVLNPFINMGVMVAVVVVKVIIRCCDRLYAFHVASVVCAT